MTRLSWNVPEGRFFDTGLDQGVLYPKGPPPVGQILFKNLIPNPSFELDFAGWTKFVSGTVGTTTATSATQAGAPYGTKVGLVTASGLGSVSDDRVGMRTEALIPVKGDAIHWFAATFGGSIPSGKTYGMWVEQYNSAQEIIQGSEQTSSVNGRVMLQVHTHFDTRYIRVYVWMRGGGSVAAVNFWVDGVMMTEGAMPDYFDGSYESNSNVTYEWLGTAHLSASVQRETLSNAVAWLGLQSVDEEGGDSAAAYYIDGRPFLFLPRPKEFKATLKAITYPDAFSKIMGVEEVADGMYLDSQMGDSFDLSYRTLVGNSIDGVDHGYKIHLVYNCTVSPQALTYESLSNSINPTSFSWEIQAVPVPVEGFRPTAHIIIDTRHMSQAKIDAVEALIYGSEDTLPSMPTPQQVFDLLSFGDTIIVTDNGDGTFDVTGSYENVYMVGNGIFRVDNVDGQDNGDGTFTISTTTE